MKFDERLAPRLCSAYTRNAAKCHEEKSSSSGVTEARTARCKVEPAQRGHKNRQLNGCLFCYFNLTSTTIGSWSA